MQRYQFDVLLTTRPFTVVTLLFLGIYLLQSFQIIDLVIHIVDSTAVKETTLLNSSYFTAQQ